MTENRIALTVVLSLSAVILDFVLAIYFKKPQPQKSIYLPTRINAAQYPQHGLISGIIAIKKQKKYSRHFMAGATAFSVLLSAI